MLMQTSIEHLVLLREAGLAVASAETSCYPEGYAYLKGIGKLKSPLEGHCGAMACMIHGICGGDIVTARVEGVQHYWNRLPDGTEIDLTSCQFGGDGRNPIKKGRKVRERPGPTPVRFLLFAARIMEKMKNGK